MDTKNITPSAKTLDELSKEYGISKRTMRKWILKFSDKIGKHEGYIFTPAQVAIIYEHLGEPC